MPRGVALPDLWVCRSQVVSMFALLAVEFFQDFGMLPCSPTGSTPMFNSGYSQDLVFTFSLASGEYLSEEHVELAHPVLSCSQHCTHWPTERFPHPRQNRLSGVQAATTTSALFQRQLGLLLLYL